MTGITSSYSVFCKQTYFFQQNSLCLLSGENANNSYQSIHVSDTRTKSAKVKMRVSESEAWLAKVTLNMDKFKLSFAFKIVL